MTLKKKFLLLITAVFLLVSACVPAVAQSNVSALFINVGKADAILLFLGDERYLIDSGTKDAHDQLMRVLDTYDVNHLDAVFITHTDKDHAGGLKKLFKAGITTDRIYTSAFYREVDLDDHRTYEAAEKYDIPLNWLRSGDEITVGDGSVFKILGPMTEDPDSDNNNSLVMRLETKEGSMLLTGDMELPEEAELMQAGLIAPADVLKVAHHGEDDATSLAFAIAVSPEWSVISTSTAEEPDTPDQKVITRLMQAGSSVAVTQDAEVGILITLLSGKVTAEQIDWQ
ncbi:MAG: MBL fold metallo-hydrolase [Clostridia bacterium]|nr:MBL fold metallo-hydrolase [Clostridia bacterium]